MNNKNQSKASGSDGNTFINCASTAGDASFESELNIIAIDACSNAIILQFYGAKIEKIINEQFRFLQSDYWFTAQE